jgi:hypothetical protein
MGVSWRKREPVPVQPGTPECAVYRCYAADGTLLYVGKTGHLGRRFAAHAGKVWFCKVATIKLTWFPSDAGAGQAEIQAIRAEQPLHNVAFKTPPVRPAPGSLRRPRISIPGCARNEPRFQQQRQPEHQRKPAYPPGSRPVPHDVRQRIMDLLARNGTITERPTAEILQVKRWQLGTWLHMLAAENLVEVHGTGRGAHWCAVQPGGEGEG